MEVPPNVYAKNEAQNAKPDLNKHATTQPMWLVKAIFIFNLYS